MLSSDQIADAARMLDEAERTKLQIGLLSVRYPQISMDDAYSVQADWIGRKIDRGDRVIGWKIGLTSKAMQQALSIDIPDSGVLLESMQFENGATIPERFIQPRIEVELAFVVNAALGDSAPEAILAATEFIAPAIEILDTRIVRKDPRSGRSRTIYDTIADNAANGGVVLGEPFRDFRSVDLPRIGAICLRDGVVEETGLAAGVLGNPLVSISWLVERLSQYGQRIEAGQIVLSGSFIRPVECPPGCNIIGDFGDLGKVEINFAANEQ